MRLRPISPDGLLGELTERVLAPSTRPWTRVCVDGAPPAGTAGLADGLAAALRVRGRPTLRVSTVDFLRPASLRFERGRTDPDSRAAWLDAGGLAREALDPLGEDGSGKVLPSLWNADTDRATRADYRHLPRGGVLVVDGELLLGRGLPFDLTVHLWLSAPALARRLPSEHHWALPAFADYDERVRPLLTADIGVRVDDPDHPAMLDDRPV